MDRSLGARVLGLGLAAAVGLAACTSAATPAPTSAPTAAPSKAASAAPTVLPGTKSFTLAFTSPGFSSAATYAAIDSLRSQGYTVDILKIDSSELLTQGVADGAFVGGGLGPNTILAAVEKGAKMQTILARNQNEWTLYGRSATIKTCADLAGKKIAVQSQGSVTVAMLNQYIKTKCPGTAPNLLIIAGSENRAAAMLADQIDGSPLEIGDSITIDVKSGGKFSQLTSFAQDLPDLHTNVFAARADWLQANPGTAVALIKAILTEYRRIAGDPAALKADAQKYMKEAINPDTIDAVAKKYTDLKMFDVNGGVTTKNLQYTADFFGPNGTGAVKTAIKLEDWTNLSFLDMALKDLGTK